MTFDNMLNLFLIPQILLLIHHVNAANIPFTKQERKRDECVDKVNAISSDIAAKAAEDATAAEHAQAQAGAEAAHHVQEELAEKAVKAAKAAQASLAGKIALVEALTREKDALDVVITELMQSKAELEKAINAELKSLSEQKGLGKVLMTAFHVAEGAAADADRSLKGVESDLVKKEKVVESAVQHAEVLDKEEQVAKTDLDKTRDATKKAVQAATEAKSNAMRNKRKITRFNY